MDLAKLVNLVLVALPADRIPLEDEIKATIAQLAAAFGFGAEDQERAFKLLAAQKLVRMDVGFALVKDHRPWVNARRPSIDPFYWNRFKVWLQTQGFPAPVIGALDRSTDAILDLLGNPAERDTWKRRGLVLGDVQSGKTATYSALINKAADAGYRFIVLLTGTIENLRRQTQERLDAGFVGYDSGEHLKRNSRNIRVGVGAIDGRRQGTVFTSSMADFRAATLDALGLSLDALREPALVVLKKNTKILENLKNWLTTYTGAAHGDVIDIPMLLIDDEADNASINTNSPETDPTAVNAAIRELLKAFRQTTYVGFTATPFANIFVDPESDAEMLGDDLFPEHFIYTLDAPTNYFGPRRLFLDDGIGDAHLRVLQDVEGHLPTRHKSTSQVTSLPASLLEALRVFLVANAIRDLRKEGPTHRSMLVNVSQFTNVQDQVQAMLDAELRRIQTDIRNFSALPPAEALGNESIERLHDTWSKEYATCGFDWATIQRALHDAVLPITTVAVNQRTGPRSLDYKAHRDTGLRVVAVGGNSLSRGLTLEGLVVSYFRRSSQMYDTLLQMGRWFGYRPGYEDLCRIYLEQAAIDWYGHIADATEELRVDLKKMFRLNRTPKDFGLSVRAHPESLLVTARNKMRSAKEITRVISVSEQSFESVELPAAPAARNENWRQVEAFVDEVKKTASGPRSHLAPTPCFRGVNRALVAKLLSHFHVPPTDFRFQPEAIADLLDSLPAGVMDEWDVAIPSGSGSDATLGSLRFPAQQRRLVRSPGTFTVSGDKRRVGSRGVEKFGLDSTQIACADANALQAAVEKAKKDGTDVPTRVNTSDRYYRQVRTSPLLILHVLEPSEKTEVSDGERREKFVAVGLSFPAIEGAPALREVRYKANPVLVRELLGDAADPGDDTEEVDEA
jgi:hypothetical protein